MSEVTKFYYEEGYNSKVTDFNPYSRNSQILCHHAFECGYVDKHRRSSAMSF
jgi:hypothetical protein